MEICVFCHAQNVRKRQENGWFVYSPPFGAQDKTLLILGGVEKHMGASDDGLCFAALFRDSLAWFSAFFRLSAGTKNQFVKH